MNSSAETRISLPNELDSADAKLVYLYLTATDEAAVSELHRTLDIPKLTLFTVLDTLTSRGLVQQAEDGYCCT
jgi:DNA-binding IclR family transcriptional regulator